MPRKSLRMHLGAGDVSSEVHPELVSQLKSAHLFGAFTDVSTPRFFKFLMQPKAIIRNGWLLDPGTEVEQSQTRSYLLRNQPTEEAVTQRLVIDRSNRTATLVTSSSDRSQEIQVDMQSFQVLSNQLHQ